MHSPGNVAPPAPRNEEPGGPSLLDGPPRGGRDPDGDLGRPMRRRSERTEELVDGTASGRASRSERAEGEGGLIPFECKEFLQRRYGGAFLSSLEDRGVDLPPRCRPSGASGSQRTAGLLDEFRECVAGSEPRQEPSIGEEDDNKSEEEEVAVPGRSLVVSRDPPEDPASTAASASSPTSSASTWDEEFNFFTATAGRREGNLRGCDAGSDCGSDSKETREGRRCATQLAVRSQKYGRLATAGCAAVAALAAVVLGAATMKKSLESTAFEFTGAAPGPVWREPPGRTHAEAAALCAADGRALCDAAALCPRGPGSRPALPPGAPAAAGPAWVPVRDGGPNAWLQVGDRDFCLSYDFVHGRPPAWGLTGEDEDGAVERRLVCCPPGAEEEEEEEGRGGDAAAPPAPHPSGGEWYDRSDGWDGRTIGDARRFCAGVDPSTFPCPYESYCPGGPRGAPAEGGAGDGTSSWVPVVDEVGVGMVRVGGDADGEDLCRVRRDLDDPRGVAEREVTHVMCCRLIA